jgi:hypothetical protein
MGKPINLYQGGAPSTFSQMGDPSISRGIADAAKTVTEGISKGVGALAQGYLQGKEAEGSVKSMEKMAKTISDDKIREPLLAYLQDTNISTSQKAKFGMDFFSEAVKNQYLMNLEMAREKSSMDLEMARQRSSMDLEMARQRSSVDIEMAKEKSRMDLLREKQSLVPNAAAFSLPDFGRNPAASGSTTNWKAEIDGGTPVKARLPADFYEYQ